MGRLFAIDGRLHHVAPLGRGHIHRTWVATYRASDGSLSRYVHQRLNTSVFADPALLLDNVSRVAAHLAEKAAVDGGQDAHRRAVRLVPAADGSPSAVDAEGGLWRTMGFIDRASSAPRFPGPAQAADAARQAARFVADLADLPPPPLPEVIPGFHDVVARLAALERAVSADGAGRAAECGPETDAVLSAAPLAALVAEARTGGRLPDRTVHNDAKADNVLFDESTGRALCLIDLDTTGPGSVLFDVGDLVRSGAATAPEDAAAGEVGVRADVVKAVLGGYASAGAGFLTAEELELLPLGGPLLALEAAARFLTDHLEGDVYFRVDVPGQNLVRARNQIRILDLLCALPPR